MGSMKESMSARHPMTIMTCVLSLASCSVHAFKYDAGLASRYRSGHIGASSRSPRFDAPSFVGSTPQIVSPFDSALLAEIKKCICELRHLVENLAACCSQTDGLSSVLDFLVTKVEAIFLQTTLITAQNDVIIDQNISIFEKVELAVSITEEVAQITNEILSIVENISSNQNCSCTDIIVSQLPILISSIDNLDIAEISSRIQELETSLSVISSKIDIDIALDQMILSKVCKIDTQLDTVESIIEEISSDTDVIISDLDLLSVIIEMSFSKVCLIESVVENISLELSLLPVIDSKCDNILFNIGSRSDFAFSQTELLSTIEQINALDLTIIAWLKTILADLHGL